MNLSHVIQKLYASEINCSISSFWDGGWDASLGDGMNGFRDSGNFDTLEEVAVFLDQEAQTHYPLSKYSKERRSNLVSDVLCDHMRELES